MTKCLRMSTIVIFLVILVVVNSGVSKKKRVRDLESVKRCFGFFCKGPQKRTYHILDLLHEQGHIPPASHPHMSPVYLVVQRCDGHAGCCDHPGLACLPKDTTTEVLEISREEVGGPQQFIRITVEQHLSCQCQSANKTHRVIMDSLKPNISLFDESGS